MTGDIVAKPLDRNDIFLKFISDWFIRKKYLMEHSDLCISFLIVKIPTGRLLVSINFFNNFILHIMP